MKDLKFNYICSFVLKSIYLLNSNNPLLISFLVFFFLPIFKIYCELPQMEMPWAFLDL